MSEAGDSSARRSTLPRVVPFDLVLVVAAAALTIVGALVPALDDTIVRRLLGVPFVLFIPGYVLAAALFPRAGDSRWYGARGASRPDRLGPLERLVLSFVLSVGLVIVLGTTLVKTPLPFGLETILATLGATTLVLAAAATVRRRAVPAEDRLVVPFGEWIDRSWAGMRRPATRVDGVLNVLLLATILVVVVSVAAGGAAPTLAGQDAGDAGAGGADDGDALSELYLLTETESGELTAEAYPTSLEHGSAEPIVVGVGNHEGSTQEYTVVVQLHGVSTVSGESGEPEVVAVEEIDRFEPTLADGERHHETVSLRPVVHGERVRATVLLYRGDAPPSPSIETAYRSTNLWLRVDDP